MFSSIFTLPFGRRDHPYCYTSNALAVLAHARQQTIEADARRPKQVEAQRQRTLAPGEPALPPPLPAPPPYVGDLGDMCAAFGNRRTLNFFLRHEQKVSA